MWNCCTASSVRWRNTITCSPASVRCSTRSAMYANLQPIIALGVAWATLHETPHLLQLVGAACIMGGLLLTRLQSAPVNPPCE